MAKDIAKKNAQSNKIIDAAIPLFAMQGFAAVSVREIATAANVNIALISYYFGGKEKLYSLILENHVGVIAELIDTISKEKEASPVEKIRHYAESFVQLHKCFPYLSHLLYSEIVNPTGCFDTIVKKVESQVSNFLYDCINEGITKGQLAPDLKPGYVAIALNSLINYYFITRRLSQKYLSRDDDQIEDCVFQAVEIYLKGILNTDYNVWKPIKT